MHPFALYAGILWKTKQQIQGFINVNTKVPVDFEKYSTIPYNPDLEKLEVQLFNVCSIHLVPYF